MRLTERTSLQRRALFKIAWKVNERNAMFLIFNYALLKCWSRDRSFLHDLGMLLDKLWAVSGSRPVLKHKLLYKIWMNASMRWRSISSVNICWLDNSIKTSHPWKGWNAASWPQIGVWLSRVCKLAERLFNEPNRRRRVLMSTNPQEFENMDWGKNHRIDSKVKS